MEKDFTQEDYELSKVIFQNMLEMFRSKHKENTAINERTLRDFAGFYCWCVVTKRIMFNTVIVNTLPYNKFMVILENGLDLYFGSDIAWTERDDFKRASYTKCYPYTPSSTLGRLTYLRSIAKHGPNDYDSHGYTISQKMEKYKKEYEIK